MAATRSRLARFGAPTAFLLAVTVVVLVVHAALGGTAGTTTGRRAHVRGTPGAAARTAERSTRAASTVAAAQYYTVQKGDTFGAIAARVGSSVARIEALNPGVSSTALQVGEKIRVR